MVARVISFLLLVILASYVLCSTQDENPQDVSLHAHLDNDVLALDDAVSGIDDKRDVQLEEDDDDKEEEEQDIQKRYWGVRWIKRRRGRTRWWKKFKRGVRTGAIRVKRAFTRRSRKLLDASAS